MKEIYITYILCSAISYFSMHVFLSALTNVELKITIKKAAVICVCFFVDIAVFFFYGNNERIISFVLGIVIKIIMGFWYERKIKRCLIISVIMIVSQGMSDAVSKILFLGKLHKEIDFIYTNSVRYMLSNMLYQLLFLVLSVFLYIYFKKRKVFIRDNEFWQVMIIMAMGSMYVFDYALTNAANNYKLEYMPSVICVLVVFGMNIIIFLFYDKLSNEQIIQEERDNLLRYVELQELEQKNVDSYNKQISKIKHDMKNYVIGVKSLIEKEKYEDAIVELDRIGKKISESNKLIITEDSVLNYILNAKIWSVNSNQIKFMCDISIDSNININAGDLSVVLGNAIDNAEEYLAQHREAEQRIYFKLMYQHGVLSMKIVNKVLENIKIPKNMVLKSTKNSRMHGLGIGSIKEIVEKYDGDIAIECENKEFCMQLSMIIG